MHPSVARAERTPDPPAALSIPPATELSGRDSYPAGQSRPGWLRLVACTQSLLLCSPAPDGPPHSLTRAARVPTARGSPLPHPTNTAAPLACAMRSAARARPEPGAQQEKEGASAAGGTRGAAGGARHSHSRPASRVARPISACRRSRALRGTRSLAWRAPPNERGTRPRSQVCKLGLTTATHRWRKRGGLGTCRGSGFPRSVHGLSVCSGCRSLPVHDPLPTASRAAHRGQQPRVVGSTAEHNAQAKSHSQLSPGAKRLLV